MKCPYCTEKSSGVNAEAITISAGAKQYKGISYSCPRCHASLSVSMDQISLNSNLEKRIAKLLGRG
jgi:hypothetical protein